ncbi:MAG: GrpB family protein [Proteobacteria bacterium]|nr:GrpB family protein [Pseudomonadota bacterium]
MEDDVQLLPYDPAWPGMFAQEAALLRQALPAGLVIGIEHFGSTAVPGLVAKPIIDILIAVASLPRAREEAVAPVCGLGYLYWEDNPKRDRMFFVKGMPPHGARRTHHVHLTEAGGEMWRRRLALRDHLRTHPDEARRYAAVKRELAVRYPTDREAYTDAKSVYLEPLYRRIGVGDA